MVVTNRRKYVRPPGVMLPCAAKVFYGSNYGRMARQVADEEYRWASCDNISNEERLVLWSDSSMVSLETQCLDVHSDIRDSHVVPNDMSDGLLFRTDCFDKYPHGIETASKSNDSFNGNDSEAPTSLSSSKLTGEGPGEVVSMQLSSMGGSIVRRKSYFDRASWEGHGLQIQICPADNNVAEFLALVRAVELAHEESTTKSQIVGLTKKLFQYRSITIYSDSKYALSTFHFERWSNGRQRKFSKCEELARAKSLIRDLADQGITVHLRWVPGHLGVQGNVRADWLARQASGHLTKAQFPILDSGFIGSLAARRASSPDTESPQCDDPKLTAANQERLSGKQTKSNTGSGDPTIGKGTVSKVDEQNGVVADEGDQPTDVFFATSLTSSYNLKTQSGICGMIITPTHYFYVSDDDESPAFEHSQILRTEGRCRGGQKRRANGNGSPTPTRSPNEQVIPSTSQQGAKMGDEASNDLVDLRSQSVPEGADTSGTDHSNGNRKRRHYEIENESPSQNTTAPRKKRKVRDLTSARPVAA